MPRPCNVSLLPGFFAIATMLGVMLMTCSPNRHHFDRPYEMSAIRALHSINVAQVQYVAMYHRYAVTLTELGPPAPGAASSAASADLIPSDLAQGAKSGYTFTMAGSPQGCVVNANPQIYNTTGSRSFFIDQSRVIREHLGNEPASANDPEIK